MLSASFQAWVVTGSHSSARRGSRPTSPVDNPHAGPQNHNGFVSATFDAWAGEARARVQERVSILSSAIGLWCAHTQQARHERKLAATADQLARGRELVLVRQILVMWAAVASEGAKQERSQAKFAERWSTKQRLCEAFSRWRSFSAGRAEADSMSDVEEGSGLTATRQYNQGQPVDLDSFTGDWNRQCADNSVSPIAPVSPSGTASLLASPSADTGVAAESTQCARQNPALDALDDLLHAEATMRKLVAKADRFYASRQAVRMVFFFTVWSQLRGIMTPRERRPPRTTSTTLDPVQEQAATEVQLTPARTDMQAQATIHPQEVDVPQTEDVPKKDTKRSMGVERWLMRQAGVISSSDDSSDDSEDGNKGMQGGLSQDDEDLRMVATAELAVAAMLQAGTVGIETSGANVDPTSAAAESDSVDGRDDAGHKQHEKEELSEAAATTAAEDSCPSDSFEQQLIESNQPEPVHAQPKLEPEPEPEPQPQLNTMQSALKSFSTTTYGNDSNCSVDVAVDEDEISLHVYMRDWVEWYFRGEWWPAPDVDVAAERLFLRLVGKQIPSASAAIDDDQCDTELSWEIHCAAQLVWYLRGDWWIHVTQAPEAVSDTVVKATRLASHAARLAMVRLQDSAVVVGGFVIWDAVATGWIFARPIERRAEQKELMRTDDAGMAPPDGRSRTAVATAAIALLRPSVRKAGGISVGLAAVTTVMVGGVYLALRVAADARRGR